MKLDFKIYVTTLDEEILIPYVIESLLTVFDSEQVEVIDLGSRDSTLSKIPSGIKVNYVDLPTGKGEAGAFFTELKNEYSLRQQWVLWVDGDEIYPTSTLLKIKQWVEDAQRGKHNSISERLYWKVLKEDKEALYCSNEYLSAGPKLFNSSHQKFNRAWPKEVTVRDDGTKAAPKSEFNSLWFWHGVLLKRSNRNERKPRKKKRETKFDLYNQFMTWSKLDRAPWRNKYRGGADQKWTVIHLDLRYGVPGVDKWGGEL